ncbi:MAG: hypothetical protein QGI05_00250 [Candidatus Omnitrophota bacterium]|nr:hypothetical protein [Candidatus Omnitrophota bacterium]
MKDKIIILLTVVLLLLFTARVLENIAPSEDRGTQSSVVYGPSQEERSRDILLDLEEVGLEPREANYYKIYND